MFRRLLPLVLVAFALFLTAAAPASAQNAPLSVDFAFVAGGKTLPAGDYTVDVSQADRVVLTPAQGTAIDITPLKPKATKNVDRTTLVFELVGSSWFLTEAHIAGQGRFVVGDTVESQDRRTVKAAKK
jgi:hypothetical protein